MRTPDRLIEAEGVSVHDIRPISPTLEDVFVQQIAASQRAAEGTR